MKLLLSIMLFSFSVVGFANTCNQTDQSGCTESTCSSIPSVGGVGGFAWNGSKCVKKSMTTRTGCPEYNSSNRSDIKKINEGDKKGATGSTTGA